MKRGITSTEGTPKPPWSRIEWQPTPRSPLQAEIQTGEWQENIHEEIESCKEQIRPFDRTELWDLAKRITNPQELISTHSSRLKLPKSTCCLNPLSRSFFKMTEMLHHLQFFDRHKDAKLKSLHICEGPGGFIESFLHCAEDRRRTVLSSYGMTLRSTHTMIPGWRRASAFLQKHSNVHLLFGPSRTGNIQEAENQFACAEAVGKTGAHLVTADGGFDFSDDFHAQEKTILRLLVSSIIIILRSVAVDGDCVLKLFDCNSRATRDIICMLASCFQQWTLQKPVTSRPCNSEWYFLGKGALRHRPVLNAFCDLRDKLAAEETIHQILTENPVDDQLLGMQRERAERQMQALKEVLQFCREGIQTANQEEMWERQRLPTAQWCQAFRMPTEQRFHL